MVSPPILDELRLTGDEQVYRLTALGDEGYRYYVSLNEFLINGYDPDSIYEVNTADLNSYRTPIYGFWQRNLSVGSLQPGAIYSNPVTHIATSKETAPSGTVEEALI